MVGGLFKRKAMEPNFDVEAESRMAIGVFDALFAGATRRQRGGLRWDGSCCSSSPSPRSRGGGLYAQWTLRPCDPPLAPAGQMGRAAAPEMRRPARAAEADAPREVEPPAVTVAKAQTRRFTDRLFVSGTLTAREEVMVAPKIADLTIVEIDAEDGDAVQKGPVARPARPLAARRAAEPERRRPRPRRRRHQRRPRA